MTGILSWTVPKPTKDEVVEWESKLKAEGLGVYRAAIWKPIQFESWEQPKKQEDY